jgi:hypothetical protein
LILSKLRGPTLQESSDSAVTEAIDKVKENHKHVAEFDQLASQFLKYKKSQNGSKTASNNTQVRRTEIDHVVQTTTEEFLLEIALTNCRFLCTDPLEMIEAIEQSYSNVNDKENQVKMYSMFNQSRVGLQDGPAKHMTKASVAKPLLSDTLSMYGLTMWRLPSTMAAHKNIYNVELKEVCEAFVKSYRRWVRRAEKAVNENKSDFCQRHCWMHVTLLRECINRFLN